MRITHFVEPYRFLSNFYGAPVFMYGKLYPTVEHAYQASKTENKLEREKIRQCQTAAQAKRMGRSVTMRKDFDELKLMFMNTLVFRKFERHASLRKLLLDTGDAELVEGNEWNDTFWGVCNGRGENHLGKILMRVREELKRKTS
jgi:N-glycosidase YbiA